MRVLIADDQIQVRSALRLMLDQELGQAVVDEAGDVERLLELAEGPRPDLVLLDWELPAEGGAAALSVLRSAWPGLKVIALSGRPEASHESLAAGVDAFISKVDPPERLVEAVSRCSAGATPGRGATGQAEQPE